MDAERAESKMHKRAGTRDRKGHPKMRVSGRGMKRFAKPGRAR